MRKPTPSRRVLSPDADPRADALTTSRRGLLAGAGVAAGAALACPFAAAAATRAPADAPQVADAPIAHDDAAQRVDWTGVHQAGIVTPRPASGLFAAFDAVVGDADDLARMFAALTERVAFLTTGGAPPERDARLPPADSGILGPQIAPDNLTITVSLGASLFDDRDWLAPHKPRNLQRMAQFPNDALIAARCHGDLALQFCANSGNTNIHALRDILKNLAPWLALRWMQAGDVPVIPPAADGRAESARNFLGFRDGTANPDAGDAALMDALVWVGEDDDEPAWARGGSYQVARIIRNTVEQWDRTPLREQEQIIGRQKMSGAPLSGGVEFDEPNYADDPDGEVTPLDAHIRLANPRTEETAENRILRRGFNYAGDVMRNGQLDQGLLFICYQSNLDRGFIAVQNRLNGEPLEEYVKPVGGGYFFALPGATGGEDVLGRALIAAVA